MVLDTSYVSWNLSHLYSSERDPQIKKDQEEQEKRSEEFIKKWKDKADWLEDPKVLRTVLNEYEEFQKEYSSGGKSIYYFKLKMEQDQNNPELKARFNKLEEFAVKIQNKMNFFEIRLSKIPKEKQNGFLKSKELEKYLHFLERAFKRGEHLLSEKEEKILNMKYSPAHRQWTKMVSGFLSKEVRYLRDEKGKKVPKNFSEIMNLLKHPNKKIRDSAAKEFHSIQKEWVEVAEAEMNAILHNKKTSDELRNFKRPEAQRHFEDDIESKVVDILIKTVSSRFELTKKYYKLKAKLFGSKKLEYHERSVPYGTITKKYSYEDSVELLYNVLLNLDSEFGKIFKQFVEKGQIDVFPKKGKRSGAFCAHHTIVSPTYILLNHTYALDDVNTIAHEVGHGINNELIRKKHHALYFDTPLSVAEVASTFMEDFVFQEIMRDADDELKLALMMLKLDKDVSTIFRQVAAYKFEQELHKKWEEKGYLPHKEIGEVFKKHMESYMGECVEQSPGSENWWVYWNHFRTFFYVYSYASGLLISKALQKEVKKNPKFIEKVKEFLSAGTSDSPKNIFRKIGVDISNEKFWNEGIDEFEELLNKTEELAEKLGKI